MTTNNSIYATEGEVADPAANADAAAAAVEGEGADKAVADKTGSEGVLDEGAAKDGDDKGGAVEGEDKAKEGDDPDKAKDEAVGAPETYADFTLPEGMVIEAAIGTEFKDWAKAKNLSQADAQSAMDMAAKHTQSIIKGFQDQHTEQVEQWAMQAKADPLVGGREYDANVQVALSVVGKFGDPELTETFEKFGLGNHPAFIRAFYRIGKAMGESGFVHGQGSEQPGKAVSRDQALADRMAAEQSRNKK